MGSTAHADLDQQLGKALRTKGFKILRIECCLGCHRSSLSFLR
jgi:hypothetical protein